MAESQRDGGEDGEEGGQEGEGGGEEEGGGDEEEKEGGGEQEEGSGEEEPPSQLGGGGGSEDSGQEGGGKLTLLSHLTLSSNLYIYIDDDVEEEVEEKLPLSKSDAEAMAAELRSMQGCVPQATLAVWHREKKLATIIGGRRKKLLDGKFDGMVTKQPVFSRYYEAVAVQVLEIIIQLESDDEEEEDPYYQYERGGFEFVIFDYCYSNMC